MTAFPTVPIVDDFNRADENPATGFVTIPTLSGVQVVSNQLKGTALQNAAYFNTQYSADMETACEVGTVPGEGGIIEIGIRAKDVGSITTVDGYSVRYTVAAGTDTISIVKTTDGTPSVLTTFNQEVVSGDEFGIKGLGTLIMAWYKSVSGLWTLLGSVADSTYQVGGYPTVVIVSTVASINNLRAGNAAPFPLAPKDRINPNILLRM